MLVFLDFEASSLTKTSYPIEVAWVFEDGAEESHLIRPAPGWDDWDPAAERIHHIPRETLLSGGMAHDVLARRMIDRLSGHDLTASAPSWDGKWLSALLRAAGLPRHSLRLRDTEQAQRDTARSLLADCVPAERIEIELEKLREGAVSPRQTRPPRHRALEDAREERARWLAVRTAAEQFRDARIRR
jgi:hypothetical protein